jgi:hypothetical protein
VTGLARDEYWTLVDTFVDSSSTSETFEHQLPHGMLVRVSTVRRVQGRTEACAESIVFVPNPPVEGGPYR